MAITRHINNKYHMTLEKHHCHKFNERNMLIKKIKLL